MHRSVAIVALFLLGAGAVSAPAGTKEELVRLQNDVLALQNQIRLLEKTFKEQTDGLRSLVVQLNDQVGKTNLLLGKLSASVESQSTGERAGTQAILQEIRGLAGKVDDTATSVSALAQQISDLKLQSKPITARTFQSSAADPASLALSADTIYNEAFNDLVQGNLDLAIEGFSAFIRNFPGSEKADDAQYGIGEAYYNRDQMPQAITAFTRVISDYPSGDKAASAYFKRAKAELAVNERENAIADFRTVVEKFPDAPETGLARAELDKLGVRPAAKPASSRPAGKKRPGF